MATTDDQDEFTLQVEIRMKAPLVWNSPANCTIQDLKEPQYDEALRLIKHHYFREEPMCKASALLQEQSSVNEYLELIKTWMKDTLSIVACSVKSGRVIGAAIMRVDSLPEKTDVYNRVQILEGVKLKSIMHLMNALIIQTNPYNRFNVHEYFRIYLICVHPSYQEKGVEIALLNVCVQVAKSLNFSTIGGIFTNGASQTKARSIGFELFSEIHYNRWVVGERVIFDDPGRGNHSAAFMGMLIPSEEELKDKEASIIDVTAKSRSEMSPEISKASNSRYMTLKSEESKDVSL